MAASTQSKPVDLRGFVLPLIALAAWQWGAHQSEIHSYVFTPLEKVFAVALDEIRSGELFWSWLASLSRTSTGFLIGAVAGISLGALMGVSRIADGVINPVYQAIRQVPLLGYIPLISLWFGNGEGSKVFIIALASFYPTTLNTYEGLRNAEAKHLAVGKVFKATRWQTLRYITLPAALPSIFTGLTLAVAFAWLSSIGSEFFFNPGPGLGNMMLNGAAAFRMEVVLLVVIAIAVTGSLSNALIARAAQWALRWRATH